MDKIQKCFNFPENGGGKSQKEETPRRITQIQLKLEKILPNTEKAERTKSFNIDFNKLKEENESFRSTTPQPMPLLSAFCSVEKRKDFLSPNKNQKKFNKIPEETIFSKRSIIILFHFFYLNIIYKYIFC